MIDDLTTAREMIRHTVATLAYRAAKPLRDVPAEFAAFRPKPGSRTAVEILAHMGDLFDWGLSLAAGKEAWSDSVPMGWEQEVSRFFASLKAFDDYLAGTQEIHCPIGRLFQGPIADALTHTGQLAMLRSLFGAPIKPENYYKADITRGVVGSNQPPARREF
ncbi:MAG TPA: hypothetical protein VMH23_02765 [Bacteroidota bacterium]|nr:hypothetical protein [Bacteroidota bacterium]